MRTASVGVCVLGTVLLFPRPALAQTVPAATTQPEFRKWDAGGSFGLRLLPSVSDDSSDLLPKGAYTLDVGRYWTVHLKTDASLTRTAFGERYVRFSSESLPGGFRNTYEIVAPVGGSVGMTYQAFDNVFVHPYVSGGVRLESISKSQYTYACTLTDCSNTTEQLPSSFVARPFAAAGFKSYFSGGRTFMRSEFVVAGGSSGPAVMFRVGAGVDF